MVVKLQRFAFGRKLIVCRDTVPLSLPAVKQVVDHCYPGCKQDEKIIDEALNRGKEDFYCYNFPPFQPEKLARPEALAAQVGHGNLFPCVEDYDS